MQSLSYYATLLTAADGMIDGTVNEISAPVRAAAVAIDPLLEASNQGTALAALESGNGAAVAVAVLRALAQHLHVDASGGTG